MEDFAKHVWLKKETNGDCSWYEGFEHGVFGEEGQVKYIRKDALQKIELDARMKDAERMYEDYVCGEVDYLDAEGAKYYNLALEHLTRDYGEVYFLPKKEK